MSGNRQEISNITLRGSVLLELNGTWRYRPTASCNNTNLKMCQKSHHVNSGILECHSPGPTTTAETMSSWDSNVCSNYLYLNTSNQHNESVCTCSLTEHRLHCPHTGWWPVRLCTLSGTRRHVSSPPVGSALRSKCGRTNVVVKHLKLEQSGGWLWQRKL